MESPKYETQKGSGNYQTTRQAMERAGQSHKIEDYKPPFHCNHLVDEFWSIRSYIGDFDKPIQKHHFAYSLINRTECFMIIAMDKAFRNELSKTRRENDKYISRKNKK